MYMKSNVPAVSDEQVSPDILDELSEGNCSTLAMEMDQNKHYDVYTTTVTAE